MNREKLRNLFLRARRVTSPRPGVSRRDFFASGALAALAAGLPSSGDASASGTQPAKPVTPRAERVYQARLRAAELERDRPAIPFVATGDETRYANRCGSYSKGLLHNSLGEVEPRAYTTYLRAIETADQAIYEQIPLGGYLKLANPQAAMAIDLLGPDAGTVDLATPPALDSAEQAGELAELYWHALLRDVPFAGYEAHPLVAQAAAEMSRMRDFRGPKENGKVTPATLFRGTSSGGRVGPYLSQFLLRDIPMSPIRIQQKMRTATPGRDYMTTVQDWLNIQNGQLAGVNTFEAAPRYILTGRDLAEYMHKDFTYQVGLCACIMLLKMSAPLDGGVPYHYSLTQSGFVTFGSSDIFHLVASVANLALKGTWYQKWIVHRRARPEELGGRVHLQFTKKSQTPFHRDLLESESLELTHQKQDTWLLSQAYPEGSPSHPAYPGGHSVLAGASITMLKACFAETWVLPSPVVPSKDGLTLVPYTGPQLTVGGELDKLAENVAFGRNFAGIHWRTDAIEGLRYGEAVAIALLREMKVTSNEFFSGFSLTKFDGTRITV